jgi:hypothetical protein
LPPTTTAAMTTTAIAIFARPTRLPESEEWAPFAKTGRSVHGFFRPTNDLRVTMLW